MKSIRKNVLLCLLFTPFATAMVYAAEPAKPAETLEQVIIKGKRADLVKLAKDVLAAEERFYQRYNELNTNRKYAVRCYNEAPTGTRFKQKYCKPVFENDADAAEAREFVTAIGRGAHAGSTSGGAVASAGPMASGGSPGTSGSTGYGTGAQMTSSTGNSAISGGGTVASFIEIESGRPDFQKNVVDVSNKSSELQKLLREHADAVKRYEALYQEVNGDAPAPASNAEAAPPPSE